MLFLSFLHVTRSWPILKPILGRALLLRWDRHASKTFTELVAEAKKLLLRKGLDHHGQGVSWKLSEEPRENPPGPSHRLS